MKLGYARVSRTDQDTALQLTALEAAGVDRVYKDEGVSGAKASRPQLDSLLESLRAGDEIVVWKLDRIARNTRHLLELVDTLESRSVTFRSLTEGIETTGPMGRAMVTIMGALAQLEREQLIERTKAGLAAAAGNNRHGGRPRIVNDAKAARVRELKAQGWSANEIAASQRISRATVYRYLEAS